MIPVNDAKAEIRDVLREYIASKRDDVPIDEALATRVKSVIELHFTGADPSEYDEIMELYRDAFGARNGAVVPLVMTPSIDALIPDGWFQRYVEWTAEHESPTQYHFGAALVGIAAGLGRRPRIAWEARRLYPNLYALLIGPTGARKGAAIERAVRLTSQALGTHVLPTEGSHQGFASALQRRFDSTKTTADGLIVAPEFRVLISRDRYKSDLFVWLTDWYDCPDEWERGLSKEVFKLRNVCVSMLGGSNLAWLRTVPEDAVTGGFFPRQLLFNATDKRFWKARPKFSPVMEKELVERLRRACNRVGPTIGFTKESEEWLDSWYEHELRKQYAKHAEDERFQAWLARKQACVMKVATILQIMDERQVNGAKFVEARSLDAARRIVDWADSSVGLIYASLGVTQEGQATDDVLTTLRRMNGRMTNRMLVRALSSKYDVNRMRAALSTLEAAGLVRIERSEEGAVWKLTDAGKR